jgi:hypothetical protein
MNKLRNSALVFSFILLVWPLFVATSIPAGSLAEQIKAIQDSPVLHIINFLVALSIAPSLLIMLKRMYPFLGTNPGRGYTKVVIFFYACYFLLVSISYGSQALYLPFILNSYPDPTVEQWFFYNNESLPITINQTGYLCWSLASLLYLTPAIRKVRGSLLSAVLIFLLSSIMQITASIGFYANNPGIAGLTFYSGLLMFPAGILVFLFAIRNRKP